MNASTFPRPLSALAISNLAYHDVSIFGWPESAGMDYWSARDVGMSGVSWWPVLRAAQGRDLIRSAEGVNLRDQSVGSNPGPWIGTDKSPARAACSA